MILGKVRKLSVCIGILAGLAGCATPPPADDPDAVAEFKQNDDPLEPTNRFIFDVNDTVYMDVLFPLARAYRFVVPPLGREMVGNVLANLKSPTIILNDLLQGNVPRAGDSLSRLLLNSSFGVAGLMDVAAPLGLPRHDSDFGQTLAVWGVGGGPYLVIPLLGPSNPRDAFGYLVDSFADPLDDYLQADGLTWIAETRFGVSVLSLSDASMDQILDIRGSSLDYYSAMRSLMRQRRVAEISEATSPSVGWVHFMPHWSVNWQGIF